MATSGSDNELFEVKEIIKQRKKKGVIEYLVRWDGFGEEEDSWEPSKSLVNCVDQIKKFVQAQDANKMEQKSAKSRSKGRARSRSRGRSRSRARSKSNTRSSKTKKSSSRSSKTTAAVVVSSDEEDLIVTPRRQSRRTEVVTRTKTRNFPGRMETSASLMKVTTDDDPEITKTTTVLRERREVNMVENHKSSIRGGESEEPNFVVKMWNYADTAVLILFICISVFLFSFVLEKYIEPRMIWKAVVNSYKSSVAYIISSFGTICTMAGSAWNTTSATLKTNWKNLSGK